MFCPFNKTSRYASKRQANSPSLISRLLLARYPVAVGWLIVAVHLLSFQGVTFSGQRPHIRKEINKPIPSFANTNTSTPVVLILTTSTVQTPLSHSFPRFVLRSFAQTVCRIAVFTTTATPCTLAKIRSRNYGFNPTVAAASPENQRNIIYPFSYGVDNSQSTDLCIRSINEPHEMFSLRSIVAYTR